MLHLLKIDLKKMTSYRTFWVIAGLYFFMIGVGAASGMEVLKFIARMIEGFGQNININRIPLYHFPDVWTNLIWTAGLLKIVLGVMVIISVSNEFTYRTARQNIIDGLSRWEFIFSKILMNLMLSLASVAVLFLVGLLTGMIYSPSLELSKMVTDLEFFPGYFLEVFMLLSLAMMIGVLVQRAGLAIVLLLSSWFLEWVVRAIIFKNMADADRPDRFFPMYSMGNIVECPFFRYGFQEIKDYVSLAAVAIALTWTLIFNGIAYFKIKRADI
jgi:ABC-type transport system involved in multi-copper enzyme maturation permease subunit